MKYHRIMELVGVDYCGNTDIPGTQCRLEYGEMDDDGRPMYVATTYNNGGFELWVGTRYQWHHHMGRKDARRLAWFILWTWWARAEWFGLRRRIYYWALHRHCEQFKRTGADHA